ncbi:MAG: beta-ketoacyl-ACP synthase [Spirochaetaceae bacterium]|jgi:3-oxoacyl-[acyl-carrier-protein] synthase II|nr:beta-ketoacyl-ACP synthase [Spirochaetaceae bacterium]
MKKRVVVTGGGVVSALGSDWQVILAKLKAGKNCVRRMDEWDKYQQMNTRLAAPVDFEFPAYPRKKIRGMGRVALLALAATENALSAASFAGSPELPRGRCGVAYGSSMGSIDALLGFYSMLILNKVQDMNATTYIKSMPQTCAANIEVFYGLTGRLITTNTACTSGSMSLGYAYETIQNGLQDLMIAGGADELSAADAAVFDTLFAASVKNDTPGLTPAACDAKRDGLVIGEGAGTLILEEYEHALNRGARIYAEVAGFGTNTDGTHLTNPNRTTMGGVMTLALRDAGLCPEAIGYVNTHGTGTAAGDVAETWATFDVFRRPVPVSTLKNYIGHTLGACGAIEAWVSVNMMNEGWFLPNINVTEIDPQCAPLDYILGEGRELETEYIMSNNFAFGGINTSLIFKKIS